MYTDAFGDTQDDFEDDEDEITYCGDDEPREPDECQGCHSGCMQCLGMSWRDFA